MIKLNITLNIKPSIDKVITNRCSALPTLYPCAVDSLNFLHAIIVIDSNGESVTLQGYSATVWELSPHFSEMCRMTGYRLCGGRVENDLFKHGPINLLLSTQLNFHISYMSVTAGQYCTRININSNNFLFINHSI